MHDESLSALLDGACSPEELSRLLDALDRSPELKARYSRMCLARDIARGLRCGRQDLDLSSRVMTALDAEPAPAKILSFPARMRLWQPLAGLAGLAAAASMAVVAVIGWLQIQNPETVAAPVAAAAPATTVAAVEAPASGFQPVAQKPSDEPLAEAESRRQLNRYLIEHIEHSPMGMARYAAHNAVYRPDERR